MIKSLFAKLKHYIITLRFSILAIFISLFVVTSTLLITLSYHRSFSTMLFIADRLMEESTKGVISEIDKQITEAAAESKYSAHLIEKNILNDDQQIFDYLIGIAERISSLQNILWADEKGNFILLLVEKPHQFTITRINRMKDPAAKTYEFYNNQLKLKSTSNDLSYDPRIRPWYKEGKKAMRTRWTKPFIYQISKHLGVLVTTPIILKNKFDGVFGLGITLNYLSRFISQLPIAKNGLISIVSTDGEVIAYSKSTPTSDIVKIQHIKDLDSQLLIQSFDIYKKTKKNKFSFFYNGEKYLVHYERIPHLSQFNWLVAALVPENQFIHELKMSALKDAAISLLILLIGIFFVSRLVTRVVKPINDLVKYTEKIKRFELDDEFHISTRIKEVLILANSLTSMKNGLKSFKKYVPATLVRKLIKRGEDVHIGGHKKCLAIFFSDIENFTKIAESMKPNQLMTYMCEYFEELTSIIAAEEGTIDKYIGDSIMAFWGAPFPVDNPGHKAALTALKCQKQLAVLNPMWREQGKKPLITRIGLHIGDVIVGNVGSSERINYTALGDNINIASRLQSLNKEYGTSILVSETFYNTIKDDFILRKVDYVVVKGKTNYFYVYELLAENKNELTFDVDSYRIHFEEAFNLYQQQEWDKAKVQFEACLKIFPEDSVAPIFIKKCI